MRLMRRRTHKTVASLVLAGQSVSASPGRRNAATPVQLSGAITGFVTDAAVSRKWARPCLLFNRQDRQFERALTDERGAFQFLRSAPRSLFRQSHAGQRSFPRSRKASWCSREWRSVLNVNLNTLFSSIQFAYPPLENGSSDERRMEVGAAQRVAPRVPCCASAATHWPATPRAVVAPHRGLHRYARHVQSVRRRRLARVRHRQ